MSDLPETQVPEAGRLLVANPLLPDPNFDRTVVLLLAYSDEGALGLVLNRPSETEVGAPLPQWEKLAATPPVVFMGGPVQHQAVICLARAAQNGPESDHDGSGDWKQVMPDVGTLDLDVDIDVLASRFARVRVFAGYAGWGPGQLGSEISSGAWWVIDAEPDDPFSEEPEQLWKQVLRRQPGKLRIVAYYPDDPTSN
ncbi:MAG: YqgE/AlgH family protein [Acidimicrobiales bacterium]|nr:YqgE/AlgH family protein [Acidimicrobiales bacterium]